MKKKEKKIKNPNSHQLVHKENPNPNYSLPIHTNSATKQNLPPKSITFKVIHTLSLSPTVNSTLISLKKN